MPNRIGSMKAISVSIGICLLALGVCSPTMAQAPPEYKVAPHAKQLPTTGSWTSRRMAVDKDNHIWVLQRPSSERQV